MNKQQALKLLTEATNEMARMTEGSSLHAQAKVKYTKAKAALIAIRNAEEVEKADAELSEITKTVAEQQNGVIRDAGVNANSVFAGFASGSLSIETPEQTRRVYELKQTIMQNTPYVMLAARQRILARRDARRANRP